MSEDAKRSRTAEQTIIGAPVPEPAPLTPTQYTYKLRQALRAAVANRKAVEVKSEAKKTCEHAWNQYRQTIRPDNADYDYRHVESYLVLYACEKCKEKRYSQLVLA